VSPVFNHCVEIVFNPPPLIYILGDKTSSEQRATSHPLGGGVRSHQRGELAPLLKPGWGSPSRVGETPLPPAGRNEAQMGPHLSSTGPHALLAALI